MSKTLVLALFLTLPLVADKRPLNENDYDSWRHIQNQVLSNDGHYLAYALFPQQGDGELVVRNLETKKEIRQPIGQLPDPPRPSYAHPQPGEMPPLPPGIAVKFTADSRLLVVSTFPAHAAVAQAERDKLPPEDWPKGDLVLVNLASGAVTRVERVRDFQLPAKASSYVAYLQLAERPVVREGPPCPPPERTANSPHPPPKPRRIEPGDLVLRNLDDNNERRFPQVSEYMLAYDAATLVYAAAGFDAASNGVFAVTPASRDNPVALLSGPGKYNKLAWDQNQTRLAFLSDRDDAASKPPRFKLYSWDRHAPAATALVSAQTAGFRPGWVISDRAALTVADGGQRIFFGTAPALKSVRSDKAIPAGQRVAFQLWSWKDDYIQPMQKVRAYTERFRSYRAMYDLAARKFVQLSDVSMNDLTPSEDGLYAIGNDDRAYRKLAEYDANYSDLYLVNTRTGTRKLVAPRCIGRLSWSPTSKYAIYFNGKDWISVTTPQGRAINLTASARVSFANELYDEAGVPDSYRLGGWTRDGESVFIYDRYDIWLCRLDGSATTNLTQGLGRKEHLAFRIVRFQNDDPQTRWIDPSEPLLLRAESEDTHDSGFYRTKVGATEPPARLCFAAKNFAPPIKARDAEVYVTAASTFSEYPDLLVSDARFEKFDKVSNADPQQAELRWGTSELIHFKNLDGQPLKAILFKPYGFDAHKKYPLLVYIYERLSQNMNLFVEPRPQNAVNPSLYASNGYLVLEPDIAYKVGSPGESALNCVLSAVDTIVDLGIVDEKSIGIQGHSWGGYQVGYMITRTSRFRAAAAGAPVADMISAYDGIRWGPGVPRQFQYERAQSRVGGTLWQYPLRFIENSPVFMADRVNTPLLMLHNDADDAVPWTQGIEYYLALRRLNKEVYFFSYNGEGHNLRRRANQMDYSRRLQQFFDYYLKGAGEPDWMKNGIPYLDSPGSDMAGDSDDQQ